MTGVIRSVALISFIFCIWFSLNANADDFLNDFFRNKVFGANPGPCTDYENACRLNYADLPQSVKDIEISFLGSNIKIGDFVKGGLFEIWELQCKNIQIGDVSLTRRSTTETQIKEVINLTNVRVACKMKIDITDLVFQTKVTLFYFSVTLSLKNYSMRFPRNFDEDTGSIEKAELGFVLNTDIDKGETFSDNLPAKIEIPSDQCTIKTKLGIFLEIEDFEKLNICISIFGCASVLTVTNRLLKFLKFLNLKVDSLVAVIIQVVEIFFGGIVCQFMEQLAVLGEGNKQTEGILNEYLTDLKNYIDKEAASKELDPRYFDTDEAILSTGLVTPNQLASSKNFAKDPTVEVLFAVINGWLGVNSTNPDYKNSLAVNQLLDQITDPSGFIDIDFMGLGFVPSILLPAGVSNATVEIERLGLYNVSTFTYFEAGSNGYDGKNESTKLRYTFLNGIAMKEVKINFRVDLFLAPGDWVSEGVSIKEFSFDFEFTMTNLQVDAALLALYNFEKIEHIKVGQLLGLDFDRITSGDDEGKYLESAIQCVSPAFAALNLTNLDMSIGAMKDFEVKNFSQDGLSDLIVNAMTLFADSAAGMISTKLPGLSRSVILNFANDLVLDKFVLPGLNGTNACPDAPPPSGKGPFVVNITSSFVLFAIDIINESLGGNPINKTRVNINEPVDLMLNYLADSLPDFPFAKQSNTSIGQWKVVDKYLENLYLNEYNRTYNRASVSEIIFGNVDSIYILTANSSEFLNAFIVETGIGGELVPLSDVETPLTLKIGFDIERDNLEAESERFEFLLLFREIDTTLAVTNLEIKMDFFNELTLGDLLSYSCLLASAAAIQFDKINYREMSLSSFEFQLKRIDVSKSSNKIRDGLDELEREILAAKNAGDSFPEAKGAFDSLINTTMGSVFDIILDQVSALPGEYNYLTVENCSAADISLDNFFEKLRRNLTKVRDYIENCTDYVDFDTLPPSSYFEDEILSKHGKDNYLDFLNSTFVSDATGFLNDFLKNDALQKTLFSLANSKSKSFLSRMFELDNVTKNVNFMLPLNSLGLTFENDDIVPGFKIEASELKIFSLNLLLDELSFFVPTGIFTTKSIVKFKPDINPNISIHAWAEANNTALGIDTLGKTRELVELEVDISQFSAIFEIITAFDLDRLLNTTVAHFLKVDANQTMSFSEFFSDCAAQMLFRQGFYINRFDINLGDSIDVKFTSPTKVLFTSGFETLTSGVMDLLMGYFTNAVGFMCYNCIRTAINDHVADLQTRIACPKSDEIELPLLSRDDEIFRFNNSGAWVEFQELWQDMFVKDEFASLNDIIDGAINNYVFFSEKDGQSISFADFSVVLSGIYYGSVDFGLYDLVLKRISLHDLELGLPVEADHFSLRSLSTMVTPEDVGYTTITTMEATHDSTWSFETNLKFDAEKIFIDMDDVQNDIFVRMSITNMSLYQLLQLKVNITSMLSMNSNILTSMKTMPCLLVSVNELLPLESKILMSSIGFEVFCNERCDLPTLEKLMKSSYETENKTELAKYLIDGANSAAQWFYDNNYNEKISSLVENVTEDTCADMGKQFVEPEPLEDVATILGYSLLVLSAFFLLCFFGLFGIHYGLKKGSSDETKSKNELEIACIALKSPFMHPGVPKLAKFGVPLFVFAGITFCALVLLYFPLASMVVKLDVLGAKTDYFAVFPLTVASVINTLWAKAGWFLALLTGICFGLLPAIQAYILLIVWFVPGKLLSEKVRGLLLFILQASGRISFIITLIFVMLYSAVNTEVSISDYRMTSTVSADNLALKLCLDFNSGFILVFINSTILLFLSHAAQYFWIKIKRYNRDAIDRANAKTHPQVQTANYNETVRCSIAAHKFTDIEGLDDSTEIDTRRIYVIAVISCVSTAIILAGLFFVTLEFEVNGVAGIVLREISFDSPTIPQGLDIKEISIVSTANSIVNAPSTSIIKTVFIYVVQFMFFFFFICMPIVQPAQLLFSIFYRMGINNARTAIRFNKVLLCWNCLDIIVLVILLTPPIIPNIMAAFINQNLDESLNVKDVCPNLGDLLVDFVADPAKNANCMSLKGALKPAFGILASGLVLQILVNFIIIRLSNAVLMDRYYKVFKDRRSDASPLVLGKLDILIVSSLAKVDSNVNKSEAEDWDKCIDEVTHE